VKVAIVHDWLVGGGAESVVLELHHLYPNAPIYTSYCTDEWRQKLDGRVVTGYLQRWPFSKLRKYLPVLRIWWFSRLKLKDYDLVISSSGNGEAKGIRLPEKTHHICYCHTPTHFYWRHYDKYMDRPGFGLLDPVVRLVFRILLGPFRHWDLKSSRRPDHFIANSSHTQADIKKYYGRESTVIHPPVDVRRFQAVRPAARQGFVTTGRQVPHKQTDIIVAACTKLNLSLTVIGNGPEHARLVTMAGPSVTFLSNVSDEDLPKYFATAQAFLFASYDDFGITPVEAMAAGTPVIAYRAGGSLDYVETGKTGLFFNEQSVEALICALKDFPNHNFSSSDIQDCARAFSVDTFREKMQQFIETVTL
jgi:glycosyltransferase involved in cell wall biosynthesis